MKTKTFLFVVFFIAAITLSVAAQEKQDYKILFEKAKYSMETKADLREAIKLFETLIKGYPQEKEFAANSQLLIGICFEKLGQQSHLMAQEAFQKVLNNYPNQSETVQLAKRRLHNINSQNQAKNPKDSKIPKEVIARKIFSERGFYGNISPDGKYLSYVDWDDGNMGIHNLETGERRKITNQGSWKPPTKFGDESLWSPDGKSLAYFWIEGKNAQLRVQDLESGKDWILAETTADNECPWPIEWTKDGKYILATASDGPNTNHTLQLVSVKDGSVKIIYNLGDQCPCGGASISPDGKYVVASLGKDLEPRDIHIFSVDGSYTNKLISFPGADWAPKWTPDGETVIFASTRTGYPALWTVKVKEGNKVGEPRFIYEGISENYYSLNFTNDGKFVFLSSYTSSNIFIASIKPDEGVIGNPTSITNNKPGIFTAPFWSPDGNNLAFISRRTDNAYHYGDNIIIHDLKTGKEEMLILDKRPLEQPSGWEWPQWLADGERMLLHNTIEGNGPRLFIVNIKSGEKKRLKGYSWKNFGPENSIIYVDSLGNKIIQQTLSTGKEKILYETKKQIYHLSISEDKTSLAFFEGEIGSGDQQELYSMQINNARPNLLWKAAKGQSFSWYSSLNFFPDGKTLLFALKTIGMDQTNSASIQFYTFNINTLKKKPLGKELRDFNDFMSNVRLSPSGKKIAYNKSRGSSGVWTLEFDY
ncbi:MAG: tetratricopeptide repeat protein [Bacteroidetes bacterium]|nr:tetratricopeptide repeat protein [Bacteroidota bacterium]